MPPRYADLALSAARKICHVRTRAVAPDVLRDVDIQLDIVDAWNDTVDFMLSAPPPTLTNTDGDLFTLTTDDFAIAAPREEIIHRLASIAGSEPEDEDGDTVVVFTQPGNPMHADWDNTIIGRAVVGRDHLRVETNSVRRANTLRARLEASLGAMIRHRLRQESNTAELMKGAAAERPATDYGTSMTAPSPEISAALRAFREKHMRGWIDESIPALDGLTPCEAARVPRKRPALELLLKEIERSESRLPPDQQIDISWLRPALGLDQQGS